MSLLKDRGDYATIPFLHGFLSAVTQGMGVEGEKGALVTDPGHSV